MGMTVSLSWDFHFVVGYYMFTEPNNQALSWLRLIIVATEVCFKRSQ